MWQPEDVPTEGTTREAGRNTTAEHSGDPTRARGEDVRRARAGVRNAGVTFGARTSRRTAGDTWRNFVDRYGWRAYALPVLVVITVAALLTSGQVRKRIGVTDGGAHRVTAPPTAPTQLALKADQAGGNVNETALKAAALPPGPAYTMTGKGTYRELAGTSPKVGTGKLWRYSIDVENGVTGVDLTRFQDLVVRTLSDKRSWSGHGVALQRVDSGRVDFHVTLTSVMTVRKLCGYSIPVETSCYIQAGNTSPVSRVVFNVARWVRGATAYVGNTDLYRVYMVNHEDGHALGHNHAHQCLADGLAPSMMQQTFGLRSAKTGKFCQANPWPYPVDKAGGVVAGAPGAEQRDTSGNDEYGHGD